jgi:hypothetical protein
LPDEEVKIGEEQDDF